MPTEGGMTIAPNSNVEYDVTTAQLWIDDVVKKFETLELSVMTACFTDDVEINYVGHDQMIGKAALHQFLKSRYAVVRNYSLKKIVRCVTGNVVGIDATVSYDDIATGRRMFGRAFEFLTVHDGKVSRWDNISVYVSCNSESKTAAT